MISHNPGAQKGILKPPILLSLKQQNLFCFHIKANVTVCFSGSHRDEERPWYSALGVMRDSGVMESVLDKESEDLDSGSSSVLIC